MKKPANLISLLGRVSRNQLPAARRLPRLLNPEVRGMATRSLASTTSICELLRRQVRGVTEIQLSLQSLEIKTIVATQEDAHVVEDDVNETKRHLNVVFIGHVDAGKSTTGGQILFLSGQVDDRTILTYEKEAKDKSRESWFMDYSMDTNEEERVKGKTVEVGRAHFETEHTRFTILDVPDPKSYVPNMISGASQADIGVLVISARKGEFESGYERGQTRERVLLAKSLGVDKLVVLINNMDEPTVKWSKERYDEIEAKMVPFLKSSGYNVKKDVQFLPISGLVGTNMNTRMDKSICSWWDGPCLFEVLDCIEVPFCDPKGPVRTILDKYKDMGIDEMRKIESGTLSGVQEKNLMAGFVLSSVGKFGLGSYHNRHFSRPFSHLPHQKESEAMPPQDSESQKRQNKASLVLGNNDLLMQKIEDALSESKQELDKSFLEHWYSTEFRPSLSCNCLLLPEGLSSKSTAFLHHQHQKSTRKDPQYISAYELMIQRVRIQNDDEWAFFWNHIINNRVFIVETWDSNVGNIETLNYDYGIKGFHKGEVDASYHDGKDGQKGKARISFVIWKEDQVISAERYEDLDCDSVHEAEAYAVMALFFKCFELEIKELVLWTDNSDIQGCISGSYTVKQKKKQTPIEEHRMNLLLLLRCIVKRFTQLRSFFKPRELMFLADDLASPSVSFPRLDDSLRKFKYQLSEKAIFKFSLAGSASAAIKTFAYNMSIGRHLQTKFFVLVDHMDKMEAVNQIRETLCPCAVYLAIHLLDEKPELQIQIKQMSGANLHHGQPVNDECTIIHQITKYKGEELVIVMDSCLHQHGYDVLGRFTVILISSMEQKQLDPAFKELNALSFGYFNGVVA